MLKHSARLKIGGSMFQKSFKSLEYDKIIDILSGFATGSKTKTVIKNMVPYTEYEDIKSALEETDDAVKVVLRYGQPPHIGYDTQDESVKRSMSGGVLSIKELLGVSSLLRMSSLYKKFIEEAEQFPALNEYLGYIYDYPDIEARIESAIINEEELNDNASPELFSIRRSIKSFNDKIRSTLNSYITSEKYRKYLQEQIVTTRNGRYVIPVKSEYKNEINGLVHDASSSGATLFIEPSSIVESNNKLRELELEERNEIQRILKDLSSQIGLCGESLLVNFEYLTKIDFAFAKAKLAIEMNAVMPKLTDKRIIDLKKARHPLLDQKKVVPIDVSLGKDFDALIITGPNTGGKTVSIKTVGLLVLMVQSGLEIPASSGSEMGVFKDVFADIGDEQSIEQNLSTFSAHLKTIGSILDSFNSASLVLFDELGAGTDPVEGAALAISIIEEIKKYGAKVMATTHYSELKLYAMTADRVKNASCEFDIETLKPTYRLIIGVPGKSNAFSISEKLGLSMEVINRASEHISKENIKFEDVLRELEENRIEAEREREKANRYLDEMNRQKEYIEKEKRDIDKKKEEIINKANERAEEIVDKIQKETDAMVSEIIKLRTQKKDSEALKKLEDVRKELKNKSSKIRKKRQQNTKAEPGEIPPNIIPGTYVYVTTTDTNGEALTCPDKKGNVIVQTGILKVTVPVTALRIAEKNEGAEVSRRYAATREFSGKSSEISPEIDLRGMYTDDAVLKAEKFIDDAAVSSLKNITIVHGKGTGALRNAIHSMLNTNRFVKSYRLGVYGEGDTGVTVVELK